MTKLTPHDRIISRCTTYKSYDATISFHNTNRTDHKYVKQLPHAEYPAAHIVAKAKRVQCKKEKKLMRMLVQA